jgi:hypothetical protein
MYKTEVIYKLNTILDNIKNYDGFWSEVNKNDIDNFEYLEEIINFLEN